MMKDLGLLGLLLSVSLGLSACGAPTGNANLASVNTNSGVANSISNSNINAVSTSGATVDTREPSQYQATVKLSFQTLGTNAQQSALPQLAAEVARSGDDRVMEFNLPTNEKVIFLDKGGVSYLILPSRKQFAELTKEALGFEVRRLMMPAEIVHQAKTVPGIKLVGEEVQNGRQVIRYAYQAQANTNTAASTIATESYMIVDKETGLPLRTETVSQSQSGGNVNGVNGVRIVTEMTDIKDTPDPSLFNLPTDYQKIDPETVKANINAIFQVVSAIAANVMQQASQHPASSNTNTNANTFATPTMTP